MARYLLQLQMGYVENASNAHLDVMLEKDDTTPLDVVKKFITDWREAFKPRALSKPCCKKSAAAAKKGIRFCGSCGDSLRGVQKDEDEEDRHQEAEDALEKFFHGTCTEVIDMEDNLTALKAAGWQIWPRMEGHFVLVHVENSNGLVGEDYDPATYIGDIHQVTVQ